MLIIEKKIKAINIHRKLKANVMYQRAKREYFFLIDHFKNLKEYHDVNDEVGKHVALNLAKKIKGIKKSQLRAILDRLWRLKSQEHRLTLHRYWIALSE